MTSIPLPEPVPTAFLRGDNMREALLDFARRTRNAHHEPRVLILDPQRPKGFILESFNGRNLPITTHHPEDNLPEADLIIHLK